MASHSEPFAPGDNRMGTGCVGRGRDGGGGGGATVFHYKFQIFHVTACTYYSVTVLSV